MRTRARHARMLGAWLAVGLLVASLTPCAAVAQPGTVMSYVKISSSTVGFTTALDASDEFGGTAIGLGDLDGAGPSAQAVAVGAAFDDDGGLDRGAVYILFLSSAGNLLSYSKISSTTTNFTTALLSGDEFGSSIAYLGDLDGAGPSVAAIAVGAPAADDGGTSRGAVFIIFLSSSGGVLSYQKISSSNFAGLDNLDEFGAAVAALGDLDGAGGSAAALAVGAPGDDDGAGSPVDRGAVYVLFLTSAGTLSSSSKISSATMGFTTALDNADEFGGAVASLGDLDGAGPSARALAVGAVFDDDGATSDRGAVYVLFLSSAGSLLSYQKISSTAGSFSGTLHTGDEFGSSLDNLGDLDGSGPAVIALAVGAPGDDDGTGGTPIDRGAVYVLFLANTGSVVSFQKISSTSGGFTGTLANADAFGSATANLGDLDGAGASKAALVVGAAGDNEGGTDKGAVYVLFLAGGATTAVPRLPGDAGTLLGGAEPNPFAARTTIRFRLERAGSARIDIWDLSGRLVRGLALEHASIGEHTVEWDGADDAGHALRAGVYFYRMSVDGLAASRTEKALVLR